ncbi:MAG: carbohydrate binding domain-containing protein [Candidatus Izimaplasma sp.]|nr:carbohydrate binding domain-containing protein [Candidatus Izimaplasma bacterium]
MKKIISVFLVVVLILTLAGCQEKEYDPPTISGIDNVTILQGEDFDPMAGVSATDYAGEDITSDIETEGFVNSMILGEHVITYSVTDDQDQTTSVNRYVTVTVEVANPYELYNGDFSVDTGGWTLDVPGGEAEFDASSGNLDVAIADAGTQWWQIQVHQTVSIEEGQAYRFSVTAKSSDGKRLGIGMEDTADGYRMLPGGNVAFELTPDFETYSYVYVSDRSIDSAKFVIYLGQIGEDDTGANVEIQKATIEEITLDSTDLEIIGLDDLVVTTGNAIDLMAGVSAVDGSGADVTDSIEIIGNAYSNLASAADFIVTYKLEVNGEILYADRLIEVVLGKSNPETLFNSDFSLGLTGWTADFPVGTGSMDVVDDVLTANLTDLGDAWWHIQLSQADIHVREGVVYEIMVRMKADQSKTVGLGIENTADGYADLKGEVVEWDVTSEWQTFTYNFTAPADLETVKYALFLGQIAETDMPTTVHVDYFIVREYTEGGASVVDNADMSSDTGWVFDFAVGTGEMMYTEENTVEANLTDLGDAWWHIQLFQDGLSIVEGKNYLVSITLKSDVDRVVGLGIEDPADGYADLKGENVEWQLTNEYQTFYYVFNANRTIDSAKLALFLGQITGDDPLSTVTVDSFDMVEVDEQNILSNSNFSNDENWNYDFVPDTGSAGTMAASNNQLTIDLTDLGSDFWHIQLHQTDISIDTNTNYLVSVRLSSTVARTIGLGIEDPADGFADLKGELVNWTVDETMQTYSYVFNSSSSIDTAKFALFLGLMTEEDTPSIITVENFVVIELVE